MKALSLFSGIGGLDLAAEAAGIETVAFCEREPFCQDVLRYHWPDVPIYDDVTTLRGEQIGAVDVIHGGFPCQPFSVAGKRKGKDDERFLWGEFARLISELEPRWVVAENVSGILSLAADDVCKDLEARGYEVEIFCYEALAVGCQHRRMRVFFVAHSRGKRRQPRNILSGDCTKAQGAGEASQPDAAGRAPGYIPNAEQERLQGRWNARVLQTQDSGERNAESLEDCCQSGADGSAQSRLGRVAYGFPLGVDLHTEPPIPRTAQGVQDRAARLKALGNAVVPAQAYPIFKAIAKIHRATNY